MEQTAARTRRPNNQAPEAAAEGPGVPSRPRTWVRAAAAALGLVALGGGAVWGWGEWQVRELARQARGAIAERRFADAEAVLQEWLRNRPAAAEAHLLLAEVALAGQRDQESLKHLLRAQQLGSSQAPAERLRAILQARAGRFAEAEPVLRRVLETTSEPDPAAAEALARIYLAGFRLAEARSVVDRWIRDAPADPRPYLHRVELAKIQGAEPLVLISDYRAALQRDPSLNQARLGLAEQLVKASRFDEAAEVFEQCLKRDPDHPGALVGAGYNALLRGDLALAKQHFDRALERSPNDPVVLREQAALDLQAGDLSSALHRIDRAIALKPWDTECHHRRALILRRLGRDDEAKKAQEVAQRLREEDTRIAEIRRRLIRSPKDEALRVELAGLLLKRGTPEEFLRWTELILRDHPGHPEVSRLLVEHYERAGNPGLANFYRGTAAPAAASLARAGSSASPTSVSAAGSPPSAAPSSADSSSPRGSGGNDP